MPLSVVGAGLGRTGTSSLKAALELLGFGPCYHMSELFLNPEHAPLWVRAANGETVWDEIFGGYHATVDYPGCNYWRELADYYPDAKILLSLRDPEKWFESTQETIFSVGMEGFLKHTPFVEFFERTTWRDFGDKIHDHDFMVDAFKRHNDDVIATAPKDRFLVYEVSQGWEPLCAFLGVPVPDTPFPRVNTREEMGGLMEKLTGGDSSRPPDMELFRKVLEERFRARKA